MEEVVMRPGQLDVQQYPYEYADGLLVVAHKQGPMTWRVKFLADDEIQLDNGVAQVSLLLER